MTSEQTERTTVPAAPAARPEPKAQADDAGAAGLAGALIRLTHTLQHVLAEAGREQGLTPQQVQLLCALSGGPVGMSELSRWLRLGRSGLTGLVDRVERRGLVARTPDADDGRACRITLTGAGEALAGRAHVGVTARVAAMAAGLDAGERAALTDAVTRVLDGAPCQSPSPQAWPERA
ncbi:MarR family winged helix-turn-helix transcriptional regulator [Streptomyces sp. WMMC500]|uniref:MarR family winged helix-turn-helix transcriptional regulator n=1 Tax=Streptomyces sp. WMMC500 TaxID=3015154 RepID=UPI00248A9B3E|nr:MarR family winged helix-turn-helix transcriptional regulator [Streptomyces sp. WMMC500]WBB61319.1 MarR family winged helix-turn-helix transcriptional regulator [Streptomyces sp. WMMC500]